MSDSLHNNCVIQENQLFYTHKKKGKQHNDFFSQIKQSNVIECVVMKILWAQNKKREKKGGTWCFNLLKEVGNMMSDFSTSKLTSSRGH